MQFNKISGIILGHALGDALGSPHEFHPHGKYTGKLEFPLTKYNRNYGLRKGVIGQVSDDTEIALALLNVLLSGYTQKKAIIEYMNWANNRDCKDCQGNAPNIGKNFRELFIIPKTSKPTIELYNNRYKKKYNTDLSKENSQSNGALMRCYPFAFISSSNRKHLLIMDTNITNPSSVAINASEAYIEAIRMAIESKSKEEIKAVVNTIITVPILIEAYKQACNNEFRDVTINPGHLSHAFYCAFWGLFNFSDYHTAINAIICLGNKDHPQSRICNDGKYPIKVGDTDTNAAIAGALLGGYYGILSMCKDKITKFNLRTLIRSNPNDGELKRPIKYIPYYTNIPYILNRSYQMYNTL